MDLLSWSMRLCSSCWPRQLPWGSRKLRKVWKLWLHLVGAEEGCWEDDACDEHHLWCASLDVQELPVQEGQRKLKCQHSASDCRTHRRASFRGQAVKTKEVTGGLDKEVDLGDPRCPDSWLIGVCINHGTGCTEQLAKRDWGSRERFPEGQ